MINSLSRAYIDISALGHNIDIVRKKIGPSRRILGVVKANAYGHGAIEIARRLELLGIDMLGVAYLEEAVELRERGIKSPILILVGVLPEQMELALRSNLTIAISDLKTASLLSLVATKTRTPAYIHIKVDTGMGRLGIELEKAQEVIPKILNLPGLNVEGIFTHLATAEEQDPSYTLFQLRNFKKLMESLAHQGIQVPIKHIANSAAVIKHPITYLDMVRVGLMLYGLAPTEKLQKMIPLRPLLSLKTKIIHIKQVKKGDSLSYGRTYICQSDMLIGVIPIGYEDGFFRSMSGKAYVLLKTKKIPVLGTICMDMAIVDLTNFQDIEIGEEVTLLGSQGEESITVHDWAYWQGTIPYEVLCSIGSRITRSYSDQRLENPIE